MSPAFPRGLKRKSVCYKLTMAGHHPRSSTSWTLALHSPSQVLSPLGPVTAPGLAACSSWAHSLQLLVSRPVCQSSAVFRIILLHIVGWEPANLGRDEEVIRTVCTLFLPLLLNTSDRFPPTLHLSYRRPQKAHPSGRHTANLPYLLQFFTHILPYQ